ncbi:MAG: hypothetical protein WC717_04395 [Candidatus Micrarchaeia archaeon]|jgi:hypothetical protein
MPYAQKTTNTVAPPQEEQMKAFYSLLDRKVDSKAGLQTLIKDLKALKLDDQGAQMVRNECVKQLENILKDKTIMGNLTNLTLAVRMSQTMP